MKIYRFIMLMLLAIPLIANGQESFEKAKISETTNQIVLKIAEINEVMGSHVGYAATRPEQYDNFIELKEKATSTELIELLNHPNPTVRSYAFWALADNHSIDLLPIVISHISDIEEVETLFGCIGGNKKVGDFMVDIARESKKLSPKQLAELDNILIYTPNNLRARDNAIKRSETIESLYPRIRELVIKDKNNSALVALAKYQKEQDIDLILDFKDEKSNAGNGYIYLAISNFPHPDFFPFLEQNFLKALDDESYRFEVKHLYKAIVSFKNDDALKLLQMSLTRMKHKTSRDECLNYALLALEENIDLIFDEIIIKLWAEESRILPKTFKYLSEKYIKKTVELSKKSLLNIDGFEATNRILDMHKIKSTNQLLSAMLKLVLEHDKGFGVKVIRENIENAYFTLFPIFADKAAEVKDKSFIPLLLSRFEDETNPIVYLKIVEALISYNDSVINKKILEIKNKNINLNKGWGGESLNKMLKKNNLL